MQTNDMYSSPWSVLESMASFAGLHPSGDRLVRGGKRLDTEAIGRSIDAAKDLVSPFLDAMRGAGNPGARPVSGWTRHRAIFGSREITEFTGWVLVRHEPDREWIVLT